MPEPKRWDVFCRVIDNHGDLGVCWRLARDLAGRGHSVRLWVDEPDALAWMAPAGCAGVEVLPWREPQVEQLVAALPADPLRAVGDVVVEAFGCDPPPSFLARMAARPVAPVWINLEYLSAESYVERSHRLASPQWRGPAAGLTKWFFYPGFTAATGGLLRESGLLAERDGWREQDAVPAERRVLLFCYDNPRLPAWLTALAADAAPVRLLLTPGFATRQVQAWAQIENQRGALALQGLPYVSQPEFDRLLWCSDLNLVRGEDSLVRAIWAGRPFIWQIYPQDDAAHADKLEAFLDLYLDGADADLALALRWVFRAWNGLALWDDARWNAVWHEQFDAWRAWASQRCSRWAESASLTDNLLQFVAAAPGRLK
ncbi:MAG: elongation factor P maturation arginine rhamnosyltransferase EarP [Leptothrix sp. (in: b-proteobacteria)]